jgi:hypothetical protein
MGTDGGYNAGRPHEEVGPFGQVEGTLFDFAHGVPLVFFRSNAFPSMDGSFPRLKQESPRGKGQINSLL